MIVKNTPLGLNISLNDRISVVRITENLVKGAQSFTAHKIPKRMADSEISPVNSINVLGIQTSSRIDCLGGTMSKLLSQRLKTWGFSFDVNSILILLSCSNCILALFVPAWNIILICGVLPLLLLFSIGLNQRLSA